MGRISVGEAIGAGFKLIGREPVAFAVWCVLYVLVYLLPTLPMWPATLAMYGALASGASPDDPAILEASNRVAALQPLSLISLLLLMAVLPPAVFRAVLFPDERRFFYLRLGAREFWTLVVTIVLFVVVVLAFIAVMLPVGLLALGGAFLAGAGGGNAGGGAFAALAVIFVGYVAGFAVVVWIMLRLSMAPVMSFAEKTFRVPESWGLTKGHAWRLFLVGLTLSVLSLIGQLLIFGAGFAAVAAGTPNLLDRMQTNPAALFASIGLPVMIAATVLFSVFGVAVYVLGAAAWAQMYRQLRPALAETFA